MGKLKNLNIGQAVNNLKQDVFNKDTIDNLEGMKITMLDINTLRDYPDNEEYFGNLEGRDFEELCESISQRGVLQPIVVRNKEDYREILAGHQRVRACRKLNKAKVPAIIKDVDDTEARLIWLQTNIKGRKLTEDKLSRAIAEEYRIIDEKRKSGELKVEGKTAQFLGNKYGMSTRKVEDLLFIARNVADDILKLGLNKSSMKEIGKLSIDEQKLLVELLGGEYIKELKTKEIEMAVSEFKSKLEQKTTEIEMTIKEKENIENNYKQLESKLKKLTQEKEQVENKLKNVLDETEKHKLESKMKQLENNESNYLEELKKLEKKYKTIEKEKKELEQKLKDKTNEVNDTLGFILNTLKRAEVKLLQLQTVDKSGINIDKLIEEAENTIENINVSLKSLKKNK